ncbi:ribosomal protein S18-alanine N-acetyltransferase [Bifidobacterium leontopitheci]|uniref:Ribosomal-protein-alanine N-acetyltransferase RimI n=1 Tax=Bifidobacterium leontopitheci TaxID=2650774 RepID=A0A6I1GH93_9BIFI|nr:ribosomal protein S18-alanine N-acetyltransferase [Bifidobacterium leontopitheci]KAB7791013.1 ribosomal-protein-alanine N-acetyltransferase RimI [Bifidobacterium leontopitheci]
MLVDYTAMERETAVTAMTRLEQELFGRHAWDRQTVADELAAPARTYIFDVDDNSIDQSDIDSASISDAAVRGFAGYWYDGEDAEIMDVGVSAAHQRQGIATNLMRHIIEHARAQGARRMLLEVSVENTPAMTLYRNLGFQRIGLRRRYYQPEGIDALVMALDLAPHIVGFTAVQSTTTQSTTTQPTTAGTAEKEQNQ